MPQRCRYVNMKLNRPTQLDEERSPTEKTKLGENVQTPDGGKDAAVAGRRPAPHNRRSLQYTPLRVEWS